MRCMRFYNVSLFSENKYLNNDDVEVYPLDVLDMDSHEKAFLHVIDKFGKVRFAHLSHVNSHDSMKSSMSHLSQLVVLIFIIYLFNIYYLLFESKRNLSTTYISVGYTR